MINTTLSDSALDALLADRPGPVGWRRSRCGNLWRNFCGKRLSVFGHRGRFKWCLSAQTGHNPHYSERSYGSEAEAMEAVCEEVNRARR